MHKSESKGSNGLPLLIKVCNRYAPSRMLSFNMAHVVIAMQLMGRLERVSRAKLMKELMLGEGAVKTLVKHMRMHGLLETSRAGTILSMRGKELYASISRMIVAEASIPKCSIAVGEFNYAVRVRGITNAIRSGVEQRDAAIRVGALGATTLVYKNARFIMPASRHDMHIREQGIMDMLKGLMPEEGDVVIIGSASSMKVAELAAKYAALTTLISLSSSRHHHNRSL